MTTMLGPSGTRADGAMAEEFDRSVRIWWIGMSWVGLCNLALWACMARPMLSTPLLKHERAQLTLSGIFVAGCASRCFVLRSDVARFAMFDHWVSTVLVGRSIATVAEVAFAGQLALVLAWLAGQTGQEKVKMLAYPIVPLLVTAQCCAWYGVLTTNYAGQTAEETLWTTAAGLFLVGLALCRRTARDPLRPFLTAGAVFCLAYLAFMATVDVPNYYALWRAKEAAGATYLTFAEGFRDVQTMKITGRYDDWRYPMVWQTLYFSVAVWISLGMAWYPFHWRQEAVKASTHSPPLCSTRTLSLTPSSSTHSETAETPRSKLEKQKLT